MRVPVRRWGNSLALRIPVSVAEDCRIKYGSVVEVSVVRGRIVVRPITSHRYSLKRLLAELICRLPAVLVAEVLGKLNTLLEA